MWHPEEAAGAYQAWLQSSDPTSSARPAESPRADVPAPEQFEEYEDFDKRVWQATKEGDHAEVAKLEWLAKKAGQVWSKEKKEAPLSLDSLPALDSNPKQYRYLDEFAQAAQKAKLEGNRDEIAKQEWLAKKAGLVWSQQKKEAAPNLDSFAATAPKTQTTFERVVDEFAHAAHQARLGGQYDEVAKAKWLAKRAGTVKQKSPNFKPDLGSAPAPKKFERVVDEFAQAAHKARLEGNYDEVAKAKWLAKMAGTIKQRSPNFKPDLGSAPAPKKFQYEVDEFEYAVNKAMLEGNYDEALKQDWMSQRAGTVWSNQKHKSPNFKPDLGSAPAPKKFQYEVDEFAQAAHKAMLEGKYDEALKQDWMAQRSGSVWSNEKYKSQIFKPDLGSAPAPKKPHTFVDEAVKQAWEAKRAGDYAEFAKQEWLAKRAGSYVK
jgi:hypothetical protein